MWRIAGYLSMLILVASCSSKGGDDTGGGSGSPIPQIISSPVTSITSGETFFYQVEVRDDDDIRHSYALSNEPSGMQVNSRGQISWDPLPGQSNSGLVSVTVSDDDGNSDTQVFRIAVSSLRLPGMVDIAAGSFVQGDPQMPRVGDSDEGPQRTVTIGAFAISKYEITVDEYLAMLNWAYDPDEDGDPSDALVLLDPPSTPRWVLNASGRRERLLDMGAADRSIAWNVDHFEALAPGDEPVVHVSWYGALFYCWSLNQRQGGNQSISIGSWSVDTSAFGYRLPTEAEWEYAAIGGLGGMIYPWGNNDPNIFATSPANYRGSGDAAEAGLDPQLMPVGSYAANNYELFDMAGNVSEWCLDWYQRDAYDGFSDDNVGEPVVDPSGPSSGFRRCVRGGSWVDEPFALRISNRDRLEPASTSSAVGFRVIEIGRVSANN